MSPSIVISFPKNSNFSAHSSETIHFSLSALIFLYVVFGLTQRFVIPKIVSGLNVVIGNTNSSSLNLTR